MSLLRQCGTSKLLRECGTGKLLRACTPPAPKNICTELLANPDLKLKLTWSGTLTRCTDCWDADDLNHYLCTAGPASLPNITDVLSCSRVLPWDPPVAALASNIVLEDWSESCGVGFHIDDIYTQARFYWTCRDGFFYLLVVGDSYGPPLFSAIAGAADLKDGETLNNLLSCMDMPWDACTSFSTAWPAFFTGGSYKVEIVP
jgi:hypothetical protein